jgi:hypothetical protein
VRHLKSLAALIVLATGVSAKADFIAYDVVPNLPLNQTEFNGAIGMDFNVGPAGIKVTSLGLFSHGQTIAAANAQLVYILNLDTGIVAVSANVFGTPVGGSQTIFNAVTATLAAGHYSIVAQGFGPSNPDYNRNRNNFVSPSNENGAGLITFTGHGRYSPFGTLPLSGPGVPDSFERPGDTNPYAAGSFTFTAVPEPSSIALLGLGAVTLLGLRSRRRKAQA